ncbi:MAG: hypothetical protein A2Y00_03225 [Omnitrophica WOR_2 bacterium GWF2_43_52]|nr:MAG: hypothetical protein A2Y00_03225 [Omnitrophica WOR_2 bacterium GWF2_43_52]HAH20865.1 hypothetical protein [Candidatus Omnitrophota bacterium]HBG64533.1 hypothetical protein [Candidatus Omnitrophota bacterium]HCD37340.1 hypothetical protein [Candidatus Omnitrophota bacterium]
MKVLLIQPPFTIYHSESKKCHPPLGLAYLAGVLRFNYDVRILDALAEGYDFQEKISPGIIRYGMAFTEIRKRIADFSPDIVGVSCLFSAQVENSLLACRAAKEVSKSILTVSGGAHPSTVPQEMLADSNLDFIVLQEGETSFPALLQALEAKSDFSRIDGIAFKKNGKIIVNPKAAMEENLDTIPFPYWQALPIKKYFHINNPHGVALSNVPFLPVITSRGCPFSCIFCSVNNLWGRGYRKRSAENVLDELQYLIDSFGVREILFEDDNLTLDKQRAINIFAGMVERKFNLRWSVPNGIAVQTLDEPMLELMKKSGCHSISIAVESGDEYILHKVIGKPLELSQVKPIVEKARKIGLETTIFFVVGFPSETREQIKHTFTFSEKLGADNVNFFYATPLPGTALFEVCRKKGYLQGKIDYSRLKSDYPVFSTDTFTVTELASAVRKQKSKLYFLYALAHPVKSVRKIWRTIIIDPRNFIRFCLRFFKGISKT